MEQGYKKVRDAEIITHWYHPIDGMQVSPQEFYAAVEQSVAKRELPHIKFNRVAWKEGGLLSASREYLRVEWRKYIYDICTAPAGAGCFFSSWLCQTKPKLTPSHIAGMLISGFFLFVLLFTIIGAILYIGVLIVLAALLRAGKFQVNPSTEEFLTGLTIIVPIIDVFFRPSTYFEVDTASMFNGIVHTAYLEVIDTFTQAKGIARIPDAERKPAMRDFFKK